MPDPTPPLTTDAIHALPEYQRTKNRVLDLLDNAQHALIELHRVKLEHERGRGSIAFQGQMLNAQNAITDAEKDAGLKLFDFYLYMRPKVLKNGALDPKMTSLAVFESAAQGQLKISEIPTGGATLLTAFNALRKYCEDVKLTHFELNDNPYLEVLRSYKGE